MLSLALLLLGTGCGKLDSFAPVTPQGGAIVSLFVLELVLAFLVSGGVAAAVFYAMYRFRDRPDAPEPVQIHGNTKLELAWTAAPVLLLIFLFVLTVRTMGTVEAEAAGALRIRVIGHQWWWEYQYPDLGIITANELHVPVGQPVRLELESADVVHNYWIPQFGWKKDNTPNHLTMMNVVVEQPGVYDGACTEFCGPQHAWMRIRAVASPPDQFQAWVAADSAAGPGCRHAASKSFNRTPASTATRSRALARRASDLTCRTSEAARLSAPASSTTPRTTSAPGSPTRNGSSLGC